MRGKAIRELAKQVRGAQEDAARPASLEAIVADNPFPAAVAACPCAPRGC